MKLITKTLNRFAFVAVLALAASGSALAQNPRIETGQLDTLAPRASQTVDVNVDEKLIQLTARFLSAKDPDEARVKDLVNRLKGVYVRSFEFETEGQYSTTDLESVRSQLRNPAWTRVVNVTSKKEGTLEVYLMQVGNQPNGLAVLAMGPKEFTVVNIVGPIDLDKLSQLEGQFGIPELEIERESKPKRKN